MSQNKKKPIYLKSHMGPTSVLQSDRALNLFTRLIWEVEVAGRVKVEPSVRWE